MNTSFVDDGLTSAGASANQQVSPFSSSFDTASSVESDRRCRKAFPRIRLIKNHVFKELLLEAVDLDRHFCSSDCEVLERTEGTFNHCVILSLNNGSEYVIKVPAQGTPELWTEGDARVLRSEVHTMQFIRRHTSIPVMQIFAWGDDCNNHLGAPYMIQEYALGFPASRLFAVPNGRPVIEETAAVLKHRQTFLRDLAFKMAELHKFTFDKSGMLYFENDPEADDAKPPTVGPWYDYVLYSPREFPAYSNTHAFFSSMIGEAISNRKQGLIQDPANDPDSFQEKIRQARLFNGLALFCDAAYSAFPGPKLPTDVPETFVLNHPDLDFQNIYIDDKGAIVGIIDWQGTCTVPRPVGFASVPLCLRADWEPSSYTLDRRLPSSMLQSYRKDYIRYMTEALSSTPSDDAKFTPHSDWYWFAANTVMEYADQTLEDFVARMMREVACLRTFEGTDMLLEFLEKNKISADVLKVLRREVGEMYAPA